MSDLEPVASLAEQLLALSDAAQAAPAGSPARLELTAQLSMLIRQRITPARRRTDGRDWAKQAAHDET